jgi:GNAT superfamily N-acetyltransferase
VERHGAIMPRHTGGVTAETTYELLPGPPTLDEYVGLRARSGLSPVTPAQGEGAVAHSWAFCHVRDTATGEAVAMGRVLGDGGWYFHVADMATLPAHQGRGLGRRVLTWLLARIEEEAPPGPYVTLNADAPGRRLYESMGFVETAPRTVAMRMAR